jgi:teichuronic acid biosynthesis glycosyltransferase TuaC
MKVLVFTSLYPNNVWAQHGVFIKERVSAFAHLDGYQVKVVAPVPYFPPIKIGQRAHFAQVMSREVIENLDVYHPRYFIIPKVSMVAHGLLMFLCALPMIKKLQRDFDFDLIDAHYVYPDGFAAVLLGRILGKPVIVSARGSDVHLFAQFPIIRRLLQYTLHKADKIIAVCQALKDSMVHLGIFAEKIAVIPNGVDAEKFYPVSSQEARRKIHLPHDQRIVLSVGRLVSDKGFDLLIKALKTLRDDSGQQDLCLVIVGEGPCRRELEQLAHALELSKHVRFVGAVPHHELYLWYSAADLFCLGSSQEGWPNVILEALASGTPVVATAVGGVPEIICTDMLGLLTQRSVHEIAGSIDRAIQKSWQSEAIVHHAREHTWDKVARAVAHVFESVFIPNTPASSQHRFTAIINTSPGE